MTTTQKRVIKAEISGTALFTGVVLIMEGYDPNPVPVGAIAGVWLLSFVVAFLWADR